MPFKVNPLTGDLIYYEKGVPLDGEEGYVLKKTLEEWAWVPPVEVIGDRVLSNPPPDNLRVTNIYVSAELKVIVEYSDISGESSGGIISVPPIGAHKVTNVFVDSITGKTVVEYDDNPAENGG